MQIVLSVILLAMQDQDGLCASSFLGRSGGKAIAMNVLDSLLMSEQDEDHGASLNFPRKWES